MKPVPLAVSTLFALLMSVLALRAEVVLQWFETQWDEIYQRLPEVAEMGYEGPVTVKPSRRVFDSRKREVIVKRTGEALTRIWQSAGLTAAGTVAESTAGAES